LVVLDASRIPPDVPLKAVRIYMIKALHGLCTRPYQALWIAPEGGAMWSETAEEARDFLPPSYRANMRAFYLVAPRNIRLTAHLSWMLGSYQTVHRADTVAGLATFIPEILFGPLCRFLEPEAEGEGGLCMAHFVERYWSLTLGSPGLEYAFGALEEAARCIQRTWTKANGRRERREAGAR